MLAAIHQRLLDAAPGLTDVQVAESVEAVGAGTKPRSGTAFIIPWREAAQASPYSTGTFRQEVIVQVIVAFLVRSHVDAKGAARAAEFDGVKSAIEGALAGWEPPGAILPMELVSGDADPQGNGATLYAQVWQTARFLTGA